MSLNVKDTGGVKRDLPEAGNHPAICVGVIEMGSYLSRDKKEYIPKVMFMFELLDEPYEWKDQTTGEVREGRVLASVEYAKFFSTNAGLRKNLESWRGRAFTTEELEGFFLGNVIGKKCNVNIIHKVSRLGNPYMKISQLAKYRSDPRFDSLQSIRDEIVLSLEPGEFKQVLFDALPNTMRENIKGTPEYKKLKSWLDKQNTGDNKPVKEEAPAPEPAVENKPTYVEHTPELEPVDVPVPEEEEAPANEEDDGLPF